MIEEEKQRVKGDRSRGRVEERTGEKGKNEKNDRETREVNVNRELGKGERQWDEKGEWKR